jgi:hypothetical protein
MSYNRNSEQYIVAQCTNSVQFVLVLILDLHLSSYGMTQHKNSFCIINSKKSKFIRHNMNFPFICRTLSENVFSVSKSLASYVTDDSKTHTELSRKI